MQGNPLNMDKSGVKPIKLSICIPTFNRARNLENCLQSLVDAKAVTRSDFEVCVSDNGSWDDTPDVLAKYQDRLQLVTNRNHENLGIPRNFLKVVGLASGEFAWLVGDDDLVLPDAIDRLCAIIDTQPVDHIFANAAHLMVDHLDKHPHPFLCENLPQNMVPFSSFERDGIYSFFDLLDPKFSFDFLGGMFLSVFRRQLWEDNKHVLDETALHSKATFSHFDNTFPHVKIFAAAFNQSKTWFAKDPFLVCITGVREWSAMYPLVHSVRLIEALEVYRAQGLEVQKYHKLRNFGLSNFLPEIANIWLNGNRAGLQYINTVGLLLNNARYPNMYLSVPRFVIRKSKLIVQAGLRRLVRGSPLSR